MALPTVDWANKIILVPQSFLTFVSGSVYEMDVDTFRLALKDLEDSEAGMMFPDTHRHTTETVLAGVTYARFVEIINGYTITFEDVGTPYAVNLFGANNNIPDATNVNQVSIRLSNSAGLISVTSGSGVTPQDKTDIVNMVWNELIANHVIAGSTAEALSNAGNGGVNIQSIVDGVLDEPIAGHSTAGTVGKAIIDSDTGINSLLDVEAGNWKIQGTIMIFYKRTGEELYRFSLLDANGMPSNQSVFQRIKL